MDELRKKRGGGEKSSLMENKKSPCHEESLMVSGEAEICGGKAISPRNEGMRLSSSNREEKKEKG